MPSVHHFAGIQRHLILKRYVLLSSTQAIEYNEVIVIESHADFIALLHAAVFACPLRAHFTQLVHAIVLFILVHGLLEETQTVVAHQPVVIDEYCAYRAVSVIVELTISRRCSVSVI